MCPYLYSRKVNYILEKLLKKMKNYSIILLSKKAKDERGKGYGGRSYI